MSGICGFLHSDPEAPAEREKLETMNSALFHRCRMWASEAKTLLPFHWVELHINALAPQHYLTFSYDSNPLTIIEGIHQLLAAHMLVIEQGGDPRVSPRWQLAFKPKEDNDCYS